ncbi:hypothetical protein TVAG_456700 [Trichomonas vaginalis G3]|uniref:Uncharacterized protein n=1 Tax=Trichomonas vaginalis (strain ATCC PRA-98 / G3) TaxID=412133 RepID=A2DBZ4_TRIV3|nr:hypothetical protein TVAGG3_0264110 [Trichomonas vaginalis G3]EAY22035.1 hypothetical protein TVAG_456700 [Trichomonas vaginalis G3]KAI5525340.1 hypothetical protein TVAGG3_0264110 [Trichomonas vaginalis G3]|eukprot:XP_001583021.1 hypothetical protein [Trichomonas vaginalis G3]
MTQLPSLVLQYTKFNYCVGTPVLLFKCKGDEFPKIIVMALTIFTSFLFMHLAIRIMRINGFALKNLSIPSVRFCLINVVRFVVMYLYNEEFVIGYNIQSRSQLHKLSIYISDFLVQSAVIFLLEISRYMQVLSIKYANILTTTINILYYIILVRFIFTSILVIIPFSKTSSLYTFVFRTYVPYYQTEFYILFCAALVLMSYTFILTDNGSLFLDERSLGYIKIGMFLFVTSFWARYLLNEFYQMVYYDHKVDHMSRKQFLYADIMFKFALYCFLPLCYYYMLFSFMIPTKKEDSNDHLDEVLEVSIF